MHRVPSRLAEGVGWTPIGAVHTMFFSSSETIHFCPTTQTHLEQGLVRVDAARVARARACRTRIVHDIVRPMAKQEGRFSWGTVMESQRLVHHHPIGNERTREGGASGDGGGRRRAAFLVPDTWVAHPLLATRDACASARRNCPRI